MQDDKPSSDIPSMGDPLSEMPWSADFLMQPLEVLPVFIWNRRLSPMRPGRADSFRRWVSGWRAAGGGRRAGYDASRYGPAGAALRALEARRQRGGADVHRRCSARLRPAAYMVGCGRRACRACPRRRYGSPQRPSTSCMSRSSRCAIWPGFFKATRLSQASSLTGKKPFQITSHSSS